jgi:hypothetical protein
MTSGRVCAPGERASRGGWVFDAPTLGPDPVFGAMDLREVYDAAVPAVAGGLLGTHIGSDG